MLDANPFTPEEIEALFRDEEEEQDTSPAEENKAQSTEEPEAKGTEQKEDEVDKTKAFAHRLKESVDKARREERDAMAKELGYSSYEEFSKSKEKKVLEENGLDAENVAPVIDQLVKTRLDSDPRFKELEELRAEKVKAFAEKELAEIKELTGGEITALSQLPREVVDLWKTEGSLKSAYMKLEGEKLIRKMRGEQSKGSTAHLTNAEGTTPADKGVRHLNAEEKEMYKFFNPGMSDEELDKITKPK